MEDSKTILIIIGAAVLALLLGSSFFGTSGMMGMMCNYGFGGMFFFGWILIVLFIVALVLLIIWLFQQVQKTGKTRRK